MFRSTDLEVETHSSRHLTFCVRQTAAITPNIFSSQKVAVCTAETDFTLQSGVRTFGAVRCVVNGNGL